MSREIDWSMRHVEKRKQTKLQDRRKMAERRLLVQVNDSRFVLPASMVEKTVFHWVLGFP
jgi:hypothetical protein